MTYRHAVPYPARYVIALLLWLVLVVGDLFLRIAFVAFVPFVWLRSYQGQQQAQTLASLADFLIRPLPRVPRFSRKPAGSRSVFLENIGHKRV